MTTRSSPDVEPVHILSVTQALRNARTLFEEHNSSFVEQRSSPQNEVAEDDLERTVTIPNKDDLDRDTNNRTTEDQLDNYENKILRKQNFIFRLNNINIYHKYQ